MDYASITNFVMEHLSPFQIIATYAIVKIALRPIEKRMDAIESKMDKLDSRMDKLDSRMDKMESRIDRLDCKIEAIRDHQMEMDKQLFAIRAMLHMKECCMMNFDERSKKAE